MRVAQLCKQVTTGDSALTILHDVSFTVNAGEAVAIVGASGSGKSTLLGLLAGLDTPSSGSVSISGEELFALDEDGRAALRARLVGFVFQSFNLLPAMTALENVMLPLELAGESGASVSAKALLERVGLGGRLTHYPKQLSGGEQQRVGIARAIVTDPTVLLCDEPTGDLDRKSGDEILTLLQTLNKDHGKTVIMVTHDPHASARASRTVHLDKGQLSNEAAP